MQVSMKFLWHSEDDFRNSLRQDGWVIVEKGDAEIDVAHPQVKTEDAARIRLHRLGLLISGAVRIEFCPFPQQK